MVGKEKEPARKGRSAGLKEDKPAAGDRSRAADKSPSRTRAARPRSQTRAAKTAKSEASPRKPSPTKSPKKEKKTPKSPVKSAAKKPAAPPSPGRRPIRPTSPARKAKETVVKRTQVITIDTDSDSDAPTTSSIQTRSRRTASKEPSVEIVNNLRSRVRRDNADLFSLRSNYEPVKKLTEFSDEDDHSPPTVAPAPAPSLRKSKSKLQIGALVSALLYCFGELGLTYLIPLLCNETQCEFRWLTRKDLDKVLGSFDLSIFFSFTSFVLFNGILSIVPFGGRRYSSMVPRDSSFEYILNGLFALIVQIAVLISLEVYHVPVTTHVVNNFFTLITSAVVLSLALGVILFVKSLYARKETLAHPERGHLSNFILGAEVNPRFGPMDVKFVLYRACTIGTVLLVLSYVYQSMEMISTPPVDPKAAAAAHWTLSLIQSIRIRPSLFVLGTLVLIYCTEPFLFESGLLSMMEFKTVSWGFLKCNEYLAGLFVYVAVPKYVYDYNVELQSWELLLCTIVFLVGYVLYRGANSQKHAFRENPYGPLVAKYDSIPSTAGKKILCSGYWGFVRHPNYLGDILLNAAISRFAWGTPLVLLFVFIFGHLVVRAYVDNKRCKQTYGVAWERYCQRVPHLLIPKVF